MKKIFTSFLFVALSSFARDPGSGSNTTVGPGPSTPGAAATDTSIMGGGTPGGKSELNLDENEPDDKRLRQMKQKQETQKSKLQNNTDQNPDSDTL